MEEGWRTTATKTQDNEDDDIEREGNDENGHAAFRRRSWTAAKAADREDGEDGKLCGVQDTRREGKEEGGAPADVGCGSQHLAKPTHALRVSSCVHSVALGRKDPYGSHQDAPAQQQQRAVLVAQECGRQLQR